MRINLCCNYIIYCSKTTKSCNFYSMIYKHRQNTVLDHSCGSICILRNSKFLIIRYSVFNFAISHITQEQKNLLIYPL